MAAEAALSSVCCEKQAFYRVEQNVRIDAFGRAPKHGPPRFRSLWTAVRPGPKQHVLNDHKSEAFLFAFWSTQIGFECGDGFFMQRNATKSARFRPLKRARLPLRPRFRRKAHKLARMSRFRPRKSQLWWLRGCHFCVISGARISVYSLRVRCRMAG